MTCAHNNRTGRGVLQVYWGARFKLKGSAMVHRTIAVLVGTLIVILAGPWGAHLSHTVADITSMSARLLLAPAALATDVIPVAPSRSGSLHFSAAGPLKADGLGPKEGFDLPPTDLDRVGVGTRAPDFTLRSSNGTRISLSDSIGKDNVVLVFYRGHW